MLFSKSRVSALLVLAYTMDVSAGGDTVAFCCPDDDLLPKEYFDECEGCYKIPSEAVENVLACPNTMFTNFPGGASRRLKDLGDGGRVVELPSGQEMVKYPDGRRLVPFPLDLPRNHRALQATGYFLGKVTPLSDCIDKENDLCCCDYTGTGTLPPGWEPGVPYKYEPCGPSCYFFDNDECALLNTNPSPVTPRPFDVLPDCVMGTGTFRTAICEPGLGLGGADPHFRSWAGEWFDFHGECSLVLLTTRRSELGPIDIHIRTKIRYDYSFIESAVLRLANSTLEVSGWGQYELDGVSNANMPARLAGYPVTYKQISDKEYLVEVHLSEEERIAMSTFKDWVTIKVENASYRNFQGSFGLMGKYPHGELVGRDGFSTFQDHSAFGQEWQVRDTEPQLFQTVNGPQYPNEHCILPDPNARGHLRKGQKVAREDAKKACAASTFYEGHLELCIADVMTSGDIDIALASRA